jgi:CspA family cold shock protein
MESVHNAHVAYHRKGTGGPTANIDVPVFQGGPERFNGQSVDSGQGTTKRYDEVKGFGIIVRDDGLYVLVRSSAIQNKFKSLREGQRVQFEAVESSDALTAANVRIVEA